MGPAFFIPLALSAISAGGEYANQQAANSRQQQAETQNIIDQQGYRNQANAQVNKLTQQVAGSNPKPIADAATEQYVQELRKNAAGSMTGGPTQNTQTFGQPVSALPTVGNFSGRYKTDTANDQKEVENYGTTQATELGQIDAAVRQRQNEGLAAENVGTNLGLLNTESWGQNFVNQLRAQSAGAQNPWIALGSNILGQAASGLSKNMAPGGGAGRPPMDTYYMPDPGNPGYSYAGNPLWAGQTGTPAGGGLA